MLKELIWKLYGRCEEAREHKPSSPLKIWRPPLRIGIGGRILKEVEHES